MTKWFNLADVYSDKGMRDVWSSYRGRISRTHAKFVRHIDTPRNDPDGGRPQRLTVITAEGLATLYEPGEPVPKLTPYPLPMRLTDKARSYLLEKNMFTTEGLEKTARVLDRESFIAMLLASKNTELLEPDFINL